MSTSHHIGVVTKTDNRLPFHAQCTCGVAGDFQEKAQAESYLQVHFSKLGGISTFEMGQPPAPKKLAHVGGVGVMPQSHAAGPPPPPPAPPNVTKGKG